MRAGRQGAERTAIAMTVMRVRVCAGCVVVVGWRNGPSELVTTNTNMCVEAFVFECVAMGKFSNKACDGWSGWLIGRDPSGVCYNYKARVRCGPRPNMGS